MHGRITGGGDGRGGVADRITAPLTLDDLAEALGRVSVKTARRHLLKAMEMDPGLSVTRRGRTLLFTPADIDRVLKALEWRPANTDFGSRRTWSVASKRQRQDQQRGTRELLAQQRLERKRDGRV